MFSREAVRKFDYVFTDGMTFTDSRGKRVRLWIPGEYEVGDKQAFMELLTDRIVGILENEPIDVYVNPTYLPAEIAGEYDSLWTEARMRRIVRAAAKHGIAVEINERFRIPSGKFIRMAGKAGVKFTFGTNNADGNFGSYAYCLRMVRECGITGDDMFIPKRHRID
jgi:histidinol phosphatase-like PHP family hydrolase